MDLNGRLRFFRPYRVLRVGVAAGFAIHRYMRLMLRERLTGRPVPEAAWDRANEAAGLSLKGIGIDLRGAFVKVCQIAGARADFFPAAFVAPLRGFFDAVPPRPFADLRPHLERDLGRPLDEIFSHVDESPLAAASLAQVHRARLRDGADVIVKIQYPEARRLFPTDLNSLRRVAAVVARLSGIDPRPLVREVAHFVALELDFRREAESCARVGRALAGSADVRVPRVYAELSGERLLVLEYLDGIRITDTERLRAEGFDLRELAERVAGIYATMIFDHGFFQGDPHPGNFLVLRGGAIGLLDFGLAKELPQGFAPALARLVAAGIMGDAAAALAAARALGFELADDQADFVVGLVRMLLGEYGNAGDQLALVESGAGTRIPGHIALVARTMILLNGLSHMLVPGERIIPLAVGRRLLPLLATP